MPNIRSALISLLILAKLMFEVIAEKRSRFHRIEVFSPLTVQLNVGEPPQRLMAKFDSRLSHLMVMDAECGNPQPRDHCPRYCSDASISAAYCHQICRENRISCVFENPFNGSRSQSVVDLGEPAVGALRGYRPFFGRSAADSTSFATMAAEKTALMPVELGETGRTKERLVLAENQIDFVRCLTFDVRYFGWVSVYRQPSAVIGLADSPHSLVRRLKNSGRIDRAVLSFQGYSLPLLSSAFVQPRISVIIGELDKFVCTDWKFFPANEDGEWTFLMEEVKFAGERIFGRNIGRIALDTTPIGIPHKVAERFERAGLLTRQFDSFYYTVDVENRSLIQLEFTVSGQSVKLHEYALFSPIGLEMTNLYDNGDQRYNNEAEWSFGSALLSAGCFGYDYEQRAVAWAERRDLRKNGDYS